MASPRASALLLLIAALLLGLGGLFVLRSGGDESDSRSVRQPTTPAPGPEPVAERETLELIPPPRVPVGGGSTETTVLWPVEVELELLRASYLPTDREQPPIGSGARAQLRGRIADSSDRGVRAEVRFVAGPNEGRVLRADVTGSFGATNLYPGLSIVQVSGGDILGSRREVRLRQGRETLLNIGYGRPGTVFGRVVDRKGEPIENARVTFDGTRATTDPDGVFYLAAIASGQCLVEIEKEGYAAWQELVMVTAGAITPKERLTFALEPQASITLYVPNDVGGPGPAHVYLLPGRADRRPSRQTPYRNGRFPFHSLNPIEVWPGKPRTIDGLPAEVLKVYAFRPGAQSTVKVASLRPGQPYSVELHLKPAARIVGRVLQDGEPVVGARVRLEAPNRSRAALAFLREPSWFLEAEVMPFLPPALQEVESGADGRFVLTAWDELTPVRYIEARGPSGGWAGRLVRAGEELVDLELESVDLGDSELVLTFPDRHQALPLELVIDGKPFDPLVLPAGEDLRVEDLLSGLWRLKVSWHGAPIEEVPELELDGTERRTIALIPEAIAGQDEESWLRVGREFPVGN